MFDTSKLSPMQLGRAEKAMAKLYRESCGAIVSQVQLVQNAVSRKVTDGSIDYSRTRFNRMNGSEQRAYEAQLAAKRYYWLEDADGIRYSVPKILYDICTLPVRGGLEP